MGMSNLDKTCFLNVDLEIYSKSDLQPLVDAMGEQVFVLFAGRVKRHYEAHIEADGSWLPMTSYMSSPESLILRLCGVILDLPPKARKLWNAAKSRTFDVGIGAPKRKTYYWSAISAEAVRAAAEVGAQIAITVYGPMKVARKPKKKQLPVSLN